MTEQSTAADLAAARVAQIRDLVAETFSVEPAQVEAAASFKDDLGADSLLLFELYTRLEELYPVTLATEDLPLLGEDLRTVCELVAARAGW